MIDGKNKLPPASGSTQAEADLHWMRHALALAERAQREHDEIPVGAVLVGADGGLLGEGCNLNISTHDPSAHAEIVAMREGGRALGNHRLVGTTLYVTLEPCAMCAGAVVAARLDRVVYGAPDPAAGCCGSVYRVTEDPAFTHFAAADGGVLEGECQALLNEFFAGRRKGKSHGPGQRHEG